VLRKNAKVELMKSVPLFARCSRKELTEIASLADELDLEAGRTLTKQGTRGQEFVVIADGAADVVRNGKRVNKLASGDFLGEIALITAQPRTATVKTTEPTRILVINAGDFRRLLRRMPSIQEKVLEALAERLPAEVG
jgi:CRP/FNR family transcriptional regulator, cyclic AMP receptor protein